MQRQQLTRLEQGGTLLQEATEGRQAGAGANHHDLRGAADAAVWVSAGHEGVGG